MPWWWPFGGGGGDADGGGPTEEPPRPTISEHTLADIARGMQHAVNSTQRLTEHHYVHLFERYFNPDGTAVTQRIVLPDGQHVLDVPVISLIPPNGLQLKEMTVDLAVQINHSVRKRAMPQGVPTDITRTSFEVSFSPRAAERGPQKKGASHGSSVDICMKFVAGDPPEGVSRVMDYYTNALVPKLLDSGEAQSSADLDPDPPEDGPGTPMADRSAEPPPRDLPKWKDDPGTRTVGDPAVGLEVPEDDEGTGVRPRFHGGGPEGPEEPLEPADPPEDPEVAPEAPEEPPEGGETPADED